MKEQEESTIRSRELGEGLRWALGQAKMSGQDIARVLNWSQSKVSRLLTGKRVASEVDVSAILAICRVTGTDRKRLLTLAREQNKPGWLQQHGSRLPAQLRTLIDHETKATSISEFESSFIPGLLQTGDYAREVLVRNANVPADEVGDRVAARLARQGIFSRDHDHRPTFGFFLHELMLYMPVGSREIMSDQLHHLLRMAVRTYISIRVIPAAFGAHAGVAGSCRLMEFADIKPVVYLEGETSGVFLEQPEEIAAYRNIFQALAEAALDEEQSKTLIANVAIDRYADRENHDDLG